MTHDHSDEDIFQEAPIGLARIGRDGTWLRVNQQLCDILGYSQEQLEKMRFQDVTHPDDLADNLSHIEQLIAGKSSSQTFPKRYIRADGSVVKANLRVRLIQGANGEGGHFISVVEDMSPTSQRLETLEHRIRHDPLTRIRNRAGFLEVVRSAYRNFQHQGQGFALIYLDLDGFKLINDTCGHLCGDMLLKGVATRLVDTIGHEGVAARMGGDEFAAILNDVATPEPIQKVKAKLHAMFTAPFRANRQNITVSASMGFAHCPTDARSLRALLQHADRDMYMAKKGELAARLSV
ncbi:sensor domain-containing diguanylate cyclase [uncultured Roseovarius sp.]|uniref:sensor domain-containing diguanylate cyclase n=1 Tax=uncultured Roseovarius sp. TaxID=293344 RepID=UPI002624B001|nr:sensor domain-containing diguanylate cyclase [uncultured Roseovarius sp.]